MTFLNSILNNSKEHNDPFKHWEYNDALTDGQLKKLLKLTYQMLVRII